MKTFINKIALTLASGLTLLTTSCSDFLTKPPLTDFTDESFWTAEANVKTFAWGLYDRFYGFGRGGTPYGEFFWQQEGTSSYEMRYTEDLLNSDFLSLPKGAYTTNGMWRNYYVDVRKTNLMIARIPNVNMTDEAKAHWTGVAKFFRANAYFNLLSSWGGVPMPLEYTSPDEQDKIYLPRSERKAVADQIIQDLKEATASIRLNADKDAINRYAAYALLARVALFEGTFVKYHNAGDATGYLTTAAEAADFLITSGKYSLGDFKAKTNSDALDGNPEMILYKRYERNLLRHTVQAYARATSPIPAGLTKQAVESYACADGLPISQSPLYKGDHGIENVLANRDKRLIGSTFDQLGYHGHAFRTIVTPTGYTAAMYDNPEKDVEDPDLFDAQNHTDAPIYTISEAYLVYAEAKAELGTLTQADLDKSINLLRDRAGITRLTLNGTDVSVGGVVINDPKRTAALETQTMGGIVNPVIWEIRRERRSELLGWNLLRHQDLDRWAKGEYMSSALNPDGMLGAWIGPVDPSEAVKVNKDGYIEAFPLNVRTFEARYYLDPIPMDEIILYQNKGKELAKNPGW